MIADYSNTPRVLGNKCCFEGYARSKMSKIGVDHLGNSITSQDSQQCQHDGRWAPAAKHLTTPPFPSKTMDCAYDDGQEITFLRWGDRTADEEKGHQKGQRTSQVLFPSLLGGELHLICHANGKCSTKIILFLFLAKDKIRK